MTPYDANIFDPDQVVDSFKGQLLINSDLDKLLDFLPHITGSKVDLQILDNWKKHFTDRGVPWVVTRRKKNHFVLWKFKEADVGRH